LILNAPTVRSTDQLIDDVWAEDAPACARGALRNLLTSLRRLLGRDLVQTCPGGYLLAALEEQIDAVRFERLLERSRGQRPDGKIRLLESALALWRGSPLVDLRYETFAQAAIRRLEELHVLALEELLGAKVELGAANSVVPELLLLVDVFPFRERLRVLLMVALYRSGRSVEALMVHASWRRLLQESWGLEPGREIEQLLHDIRTHAPALA
jgi:DNA-binding SARP family transcriptional activator